MSDRISEITSVREIISEQTGEEKSSYAGRIWTWIRGDHLLSRFLYAILVTLGLRTPDFPAEPSNEKPAKPKLSPDIQAQIDELTKTVAKYRSGELKEEEGRLAMERLREIDPTTGRQHQLHKKLGHESNGRVRAWRALYTAKDRKAPFVKIGPGKTINTTYTNTAKDLVAKLPSRIPMMEEELRMDALFALFGNQKIVPSRYCKNLKCTTQGGGEAPFSLLVKPYENFVTFGKISQLVRGPDEKIKTEQLLATLDKDSKEALLLSFLFQFADLHGGNIGFRPKKSAELAPLYRAKKIQLGRKSCDLPTLWTGVATGSIEGTVKLNITWQDGSSSWGAINEIRIPGYPALTVEEALRSAEGELVLFDTDVSFLESDHYAETISGFFNPSYLPAIRNRLLKTEFAEKPLPEAFFLDFLQKLETSIEEIHRHTFKWHLPVRQRLSAEENQKLDEIIRELTKEYTLHGPAPGPHLSVIHGKKTVRDLAKQFAEEFQESPKKFHKLWDFLKKKDISFEGREEVLLQSLFPSCTIAQYDALQERKTHLETAISGHKEGHSLSLLDLAEAMYPHLHEAIRLSKYGYREISLRIF